MPISIVRNDITKMKVDAIVNPTNPALSGAGGLDAAIHRAAGEALDRECRAIGGCRIGGAVLTAGYALPARYVIHTAGPLWRGGGHGERALLADCYRSCLELARDHGCESVAFPLISAGTYGFPKDEAMAVALDVIGRFLFEANLSVILVVFGREETLTGRRLFSDVQEYIDDVYAESHYPSRRRNAAAAELREQEAYLPRFERSRPAVIGAAQDLEQALRAADESFAQALLRLIDERGMTDVQCYTRANIDKRLFSKIRSNPDYRPSKPTAFAFAVALELSLPEAAALLRKAGFAISHSSKLDIIVEYFIKARRYDIYEINNTLFDFDQPLLGNNPR